MLVCAKALLSIATVFVDPFCTVALSKPVIWLRIATHTHHGYQHESTAILSPLNYKPSLHRTHMLCMSLEKTPVEIFSIGADA